MQLENTEQPVRRELLSQQFDEVQNEAPVEAVRTQEQPNLEPPAEPPVWERPPASWKKDYHEAWTTADPKLKEYAWKREEEMRAGVQPLLTKAQYADQMQQAIEPYMNNIRGLGIEAPQAVKALMEADNVLRHGSPQQKQAYFAQLAQQYGINMSDVQIQPTDPNFYAIQNELAQVRGEVLNWKQAQENAQNEALLSEINQFQSKAEYFEEARPTMIQLLNSGVAKDLDDAYQKAIRLDNDLFTKHQQASQGQADAAKREASNRAAKAARAAAVSVKSSTPGAATSTKAQDRRSLLMEQFDNLNERF
jgi:hypothetical protein